VAIFARSLRLPARVPGASRPELINAVRISGPPLHRLRAAGGRVDPPGHGPDARR
jgi:hypothetical protein